MKKSIIYFISFFFIISLTTASNNSFIKLPSSVDGVEYVYNTPKSSIYIRNNGLSLVSKRYSFEPNLQNSNQNNKSIAELHRVDINFEGSNENLNVVAKNLKHTSKFILENSKQKELLTTKEIYISNVYNGIDFRGYFTKTNKFEFDFIVHANANPNDIELSLNYTNGQTLSDNSELILQTEIDDIILQSPFCYQSVEDADIFIESNYKLDGNIVSFQIGEYNHSETLIIDPITRFMGSYFGGNGNDTGYDIDEDSQGNYYLTGFTESVTKIAKAGYQMMHGGLEDAYLAKFDSEDNLIWSTYFGSHNFEVSYAINVDKLGSVIIVGETNSSQNISTPNGHQQTYGGGDSDGFIAKFMGNGQLDWSTYFGGQGAEKINDVVTDEFGNIYVTGFTNSDDNIAFNGYKMQRAGSYDAFFAKFNPIGIMQWGTYYGGNLDDYGNGIAIDESRNIYIIGSTESSNDISYLGYIPSIMGKTDAFATAFNTDCAIIWGTYFGGPEDDIGKSIAIEGNLMYLVGDTKSQRDIASGGFQDLPGGGWDGFLAKFDIIQSPYWSTYYGGTGDDFLNKVEAVNSSIYTAGSTNSTAQIELLGWQPVYGGGTSDGTFAKYKTSNELEWSTYYGGSGRDVLRSTTATGKLYVAGFTNSDNGINQDGYQPTRSSQLDALFGEMSESELLLSVNDDEFCAGKDYIVAVDYINLVFKQDNEFIVEMSDNKGNFVDAEEVGRIKSNSKTNVNITIPGFYKYSKKYKFRLKSTSPKYNGRTLQDSATVYPRPIIDWSADPLCVNNSRIFSTDKHPNVSYKWEYEAAQKIDSSEISIKLRWAESGDYVVRLISENPVCIDTSHVNVTVSPLPNGAFTGPINACGNSIVQYNVFEDKGYVYDWSAEDGAVLSQSDDGKALIIWNNIETTGKVILTVQDTITGCISSKEQQVVISESPIAVITGSDTTCKGCSEALFTDDNGISVWEITNGIITNESNTQVTIKTNEQADSVIVTLIKSSESNECKDSVKKVIYLTDSPVTSITGLKNVCEFEEYDYFTSSNTELTNDWIVTGGEIIADNGTNITIRWGQSGNGKIRLRQEAKDKSYLDSADMAIIINPKPTTFNHNIPSNACSGDSVIFDFKLLEGEKVTITDNGKSFKNGDTYRFSNFGDLELKFEITNTFGCKLNGVANVSVVPSPEAAKLEIIDGKIYSDKSGKHRWYLEGVLIEGEEGSSIEPQEEGEYTAEYLGGGCWSVTSEPVDFTQSSVENIVEAGINIYPIPADDKLIINSDFIIEEMSLINLLGKELIITNYFTKKEIDISNINPGIYFVKIWVNDKLLTKKIIIK